jgi:fumarate reductase subunit C
LDLKNQPRNFSKGIIDKIIFLIMVIPALLALQRDSSQSVSNQFISMMTTPICLVVIGISIVWALQAQTDLVSESGGD